MKWIVKKYWLMLIKLFRSKERINFIIRLLIISIILFLFFYFIERYKKSKNYMDQYVKMSIYNDGSSGTQALKEFLKTFNIKTDKILEPLINIKKHSQKYSLYSMPPGIILIIEPEKYLRKVDIESIKLKAREGFTIIIFTKWENKISAFFKKKKKKKEDKKKKSKKKPLSSRTLSDSYTLHTNILFLSALKSLTKLNYDRYGIFYDVNKIELISKKRFKKRAGGWKILAKDKYGMIALLKKVGKGEIILFSDSQFISNHYLRKADNGMFIYRLIKYFLKNRTVYFNEYYHGYQTRYTLLYFFARKDYFNVILQFLIFFIFLFLSSGIKFGQYRKEIKMEQEKIYYFSEGMANLMAKKKYSNGLFNLMIENFKKTANLKHSTGIKQKLSKINELAALKKGYKSLVIKIFKIIKNKEKE